MNLRRDSKPAAFISTTRDDFTPQFSPDGKYVAFVSARSGSTEIWVSDASGSNAVQVTSFGGPDVAAPSWSPDGGRIAFASNAAGGYDIWVMSANGGNSQRITMDPATDANPAWSRDGRWIYFDSARSGGNQIWKVPASGGDAIQLTKDGGGIPRESPDGKFIYYANCPALWRISPQGGVATKVLDPLPSYRNLAITDTGLYVVAPRNGAPGSSLQYLSFANNQVITVANLEDFHDIGQAGGLAISPDGGSILYTNVDQSSIELMMLENFR